MRLSTPLLFLPILTSAAAALHLQVNLPSNPSHPSSTTATLQTQSTLKKSHISTDSSFSFRNVSAGSYLFDITSPTHTFPPLRIDVEDSSVEAWGTFRGNEWGNKGEVMGVERDGERWIVKVEREGKGKVFYEERVGFSPLSMLMNPMILMAGAAMLMVFGMPYLMENMDPEMKAELEARQKNGGISGQVNSALLGGGAGGAGGFDAAAWLAGAGKGTGDVGDKEIAKGVSR